MTNIDTLYDSSCSSSYGVVPYDAPIRYLEPPTPNFVPDCPVNIDTDSLPSNIPREISLYGHSSVKHIYGSPSYPMIGYFPPQTVSKPNNTMYMPSGKRNYIGRRVSYGSQRFPMHDSNPREIRYYTDKFLPIPDLFSYTKYKTPMLNEPNLRNETKTII